MYEVLIERRVERQLRRLPEDVLRRIARVMVDLGKDPRPPGCRKLVGSTNDWRIRVGDYRLLYEVIDADRVVRVMHVRHRRDAYK